MIKAYSRDEIVFEIVKDNKGNKLYKLDPIVIYPYKNPMPKEEVMEWFRIVDSQAFYVSEVNNDKIK